MVMTDWFGGSDAVAQMIAGNDMLQPGRTQQYDDIYNAVKNGKLDESILDRNIKRILQLIVKCPHFKGYKHSDKPDLTAHAAITRSSATEGMILLKNENQALPFQSSVKNVAVYGCTSYDIIPGGTGSGNVNRAYTVSLIEGLRNANYVVDPNILSKYLTYKNEEKKKNERSGSFDQLAMFSAPRSKELVPTAEELNKAVADNDIAVITLGRISGEFLDRNVNDFNLSPEEKELIQKVCAAFQQANKKVVVVLNIGGVIETASWKNQPDAILCAWQAGQEGGNSIADILSGKQNPSGKLTMTFPIHVDDAYSSKNFPMNSPSINDMKAFMEQRKNRTTKDEKNFDYTNYEEDIYVGYRYFDSFNKEVSYPFGYGLSYTTFSYSDLNVLNNGTNYDVTFTVTNTGKCKGKEVTEVYVTASKGKLNVPAQELKGFAKTRLLNPGESQEISISIPVESLASYDDKTTAWVTKSGNYQFKVGASSRDIKLEKTIKVKSYKQKTSNSLKPQETLNLLKP
jgi:beta-glucosidase